MASNKEINNSWLFSLIDLAFILLLIQIILSREGSALQNGMNKAQNGKVTKMMNVCMNNYHVWVYDEDGKELLSKINYGEQRNNTYRLLCADTLKDVFNKMKIGDNQIWFKIEDGTRFWGPYRVMALMKDTCGFKNEILIEKK